MQRLQYHTSMASTRQIRRPGTLRADAREAADACVAEAMRAAARDATRAVDDALAPLGLTGPQFTLMCRVASADDDRIGALARRSGLDASTLSRALDALARRGWVEVATVGADRRRRLAWLTESGLRTLADAMPRWRAAQAALHAALDARTLGALRRAQATLSAPAREDPGPVRTPKVAGRRQETPS